MLKSQVYQGMNTQQMHISVDPNAFQDTERYSSTKIVLTLSALD